MTEARATRHFVKRRDPARPGSIPDVLQMFTREVRFYREVAPHLGVRVPVCHVAEEHGGATHLQLQVAVECCVYGALALGVARANRWFRRSAVRRRLEAVTGTVLVALGVRLALSDR